MTCAGPDCERPTFRRGLCRGHYWQRHQAGKALTPLQPRGQDPEERLLAAALVIAAAESDEDFVRAWARLTSAAKGFVFGPPRCSRTNCERRRYRDGLCFAHARPARTAAVAA